MFDRSAHLPWFIGIWCVPAFLWLILLELIVVAQASASGPSNSLGPPLFVLLIQTMHMIICTCMKVNIFLLVCCTKSTYQINHRIRFRKKKKKKKNNKLCYLTMAIIWYISILELLVNMSTIVHNIFSRWRPWQPSWISNRNNFSYFWSTIKLPRY